VAAQGSPGRGGDVVSMRVHASYRPDYAKLSSSQIVAARQKLGFTHAEFADYLSDTLGWPVYESAVKRWETRKPPPGDALLACTDITQGTVDAGPAAPLLTAVPPSFPAGTLDGPWVTCYQFSHAGQPRCHADIAHISAGPHGRVRAVNHPPEPRSQGRRRPFRNEIDAALAGRHLLGAWQNTSDTRYYGTLQLAVLPGETVMEGYFAGVGSDVEVSAGTWKWVRLEVDPDVRLAGIILREPAELHDLVMTHSQIDVPLTLTDVRGER